MLHYDDNVPFTLITKDTDIKSLTMDKLDWDVVLDGVPYQIVRINGYVHSMGAGCPWYYNDMWAYPLNEEPSYQNMRTYSLPKDGPVNWGLIMEPKYGDIYRHEQRELAHRTTYTITRNGERFHCGRGSISHFLDLIEKIQEHPLNFNQRGYDDEIIGRLVWWRSEPAIVADYYKEDADVILYPDGIEYFKTPNEYLNSQIPFYNEGLVRTSVFDEHINWFREKGCYGKDVDPRIAEARRNPKYIERDHLYWCALAKIGVISKDDIPPLECKVEGDFKIIPNEVPGKAAKATAYGEIGQPEIRVDTEKGDSIIYDALARACCDDMDKQIKQYIGGTESLIGPPLDPKAKSDK